MNGLSLQDGRPRPAEFELLPPLTLEHGLEQQSHSVQNAPLATADALYGSPTALLPLTSLFGVVYETYAKNFSLKPSDPRIYCDINAPASFVVCGVQVSVCSVRVVNLRSQALTRKRADLTGIRQESHFCSAVGECLDQRWTHRLAARPARRLRVSFRH